MQPDLSLKENVIHGTKKNPIAALHFTAGEGTAFPRHFFVERHWHPYVELLFIRKGSYLFEINLENHILKEGDFCILNSGDLHQITGLETGAVHDVLLFDPQILDFSYGDEWEDQFITPFLNRTLVIQNIIRPENSCYSSLLPQIRQLFSNTFHKENGWYMQAKLQLFELLFSLYRQNLLFQAKTVRSAADIRKIQRYKSIISYVHEHYMEPISLKQLSDIIPCNSQYLCRFFKEIAGITPIQYLINYRIEEAEKQLSHTKKPVIEIAMDCGFENISYFIRKFKEIKSCTPMEYRRRQNENT